MHSSIMRLSESSMDKLYDLMTMGVKHQLLGCRLKAPPASWHLVRHPVPADAALDLQVVRRAAELAAGARACTEAACHGAGCGWTRLCR